jgi:hypothetical protein
MRNAPAHCTSLGIPFFGIITIPISIYRGGDGDDSFCGGSHVRQTWDGCHLTPLGGHLGEPEAPVEERHTGFFLLLLRFLRGCMRRLCVHTRYSDSGGDLQDSQPHKGFSPHSSRGLSKSSVIPLSGVEGEELSAALALCMGGIDLMQPPTPVQGLYTKAIAQKA